MGLTEHDLTGTTSGGPTSRTQGGHTVETSVAAPAALSRSGGATGTTNGTGTDQQPSGAATGGSSALRALRRGKNRTKCVFGIRACVMLRFLHVTVMACHCVRQRWPKTLFLCLWNPVLTVQPHCLVDHHKTESKPKLRRASCISANTCLLCLPMLDFRQARR